MQETNKTAKTNKANCLTWKKFAKDNQLDPEKALEIAKYFYKNHLVIPSNILAERKPIVYMSKASHHSDGYIIHQLAKDIFLAKYKEKYGQKD
ncbi:MAG: hypothetical protein MJ170_00995 [Alphaproteobacteria bacterium]|nr:hypothetical protein [Alphaproteobacteria bacterium]